MTVEALMNVTVTVRHHEGFTQSASGEPTSDYSETETIMALQPQEDARRSTEALEAGYVPTGKWLGFGLADFPFDSHDQIVWDHRVFDIIAPPRPMPNHRLNTISHQELDLQEVGEFEAGVDATATPGVVGGFGG